MLLFHQVMERFFSHIEEQNHQSPISSFTIPLYVFPVEYHLGVMIIHSFKDLIVWQKSMTLVEVIYQVTESFPKSEQYELTSQMRRASTSIPFNIAEGRRRKTRKDFCRFLTIAYGSGGELETQIEVAKRLPFAKHLNFELAESLLNEVMRMLNVMITKLRVSKPKQLKG